MTRLIDRIKGALQGASSQQAHDHESSLVHEHVKEGSASSEPATEEHPAGHEHGKNGHKHC